MTTVHLASGPLDDRRRGELVYAGDLVLFRDVAAVRALCAHGAALAREAFDGADPRTAQFSLDRDDHAARVAALQRRWRDDPEVARLVAAALAAVGVDPQRTCWERPHLRVVRHRDADATAQPDSAQLGAHRDTWSSNVYAQTNWWLPILPIQADSTIAFHPDRWSRGIGNTSADWDLDAIRAANRGRKRGEPLSGDVPLVPEPTEPVDPASELRVVPEPGDVLCFSGAHLHASVPNTSGATRFSVEVRTVHVDDVVAGRGAPNVDGRAPRVPLEWFRGMDDGVPLPRAVERAGGHVAGRP